MSFPHLSVPRLVSGMDSSFQALKQRGKNGNMGGERFQRVSLTENTRAILIPAKKKRCQQLLSGHAIKRCI
jgi:hypothetical protein